MPACRGFTLLEILVALAVLAIGLSAAIRGSATGITTVGELRDRQLATWVADNQLALLRASRQWPGLGRAEGFSEMAGQRFVWIQQVRTSEDARFRRVEISVAREDNVLAQRVAHVLRP